MPHLTRQNSKLYPDPETGHKKIRGVWKTLQKGEDSNNDANYTITPSGDDIAVLEGGTSDTQSDFDTAQDVYEYETDGGTPRAGLEPNWFRGKGAAGTTLGGVKVEGLSARVRAAMDALQAGYGPHEFEVIGGTGSRAGYVSWQVKGAEGPADQTWTMYETDDGGLYMYDKEVGMSSMETILAPLTVTPTDPGVTEAGSITNADGSVTKFYSVTDASGRTSMQKVTTPAERQAPKESDIVNFTDAEGGGRLIPLGDGRYTYEPPEDEPFKTSAADVIPLPKQGGSLVKTSENQYQFVRDTYEPGVVQDPVTGRYFSQSASGIWTELDPRADPGVVESGGRDFLQQYTGALSELDPRFDPGVTDVDGMALLQQRSGAISHTRTSNAVPKLVVPLQKKKPLAYPHGRRQVLVLRQIHFRPVLKGCYETTSVGTRNIPLRWRA
jgi:hypothetical protein